ncbi:MAG: type II toxin-antitoxin system Phd/YefM family antitoxin [Clostridia bacterium]|nr:type II toxin-antitoxin system Phd/YefM family antitoxin [Clostridia bacterium]
MPAIRPCADLRNNYNEISEFCHEYSEPVFITKNGKGDLAVMSIDVYERLSGKYELYQMLDKGMSDIEAGKTKPYADFMSEFGRKHLE